MIAKVIVLLFIVGVCVCENTPQETKPESHIQHIPPKTPTIQTLPAPLPAPLPKQRRDTVIMKEEKPKVAPVPPIAKLPAPGPVAQTKDAPKSTH